MTPNDEANRRHGSQFSVARRNPLMAVFALGALVSLTSAASLASEGAPLAFPGEVDNVVLESIPGGVRVSWDETSGAGAVYDIFTGTIAGLVGSGGDFSTGACLVEDHATVSYDDLTPPPAPGEVAYVVVRAQNIRRTADFRVE